MGQRHWICFSTCCSHSHHHHRVWGSKVWDLQPQAPPGGLILFQVNPGLWTHIDNSQKSQARGENGVLARRDRKANGKGLEVVIKEPKVRKEGQLEQAGSGASPGEIRSKSEARVDGGTELHILRT